MRYLFPSVLIFLLLGCSRQGDTVYQVSTIDALLAGLYEGNESCSELLDHGDFGIGTFADLDGEMVILDGGLFQVKADGNIYEPDHSVLTPFASVCHFNPESSFQPDTIADYLTMQKLMDQQAGNQNLIFAIRITGQFRTMHTRSVPRQSKPYPPLSEVTAHQPEFRAESCSGTIVGFRFPSYVKGMNIPGYHLHFISDDRSCGGHILDFELLRGTCEMDVINQYQVKLPQDNKAFAETDLSGDRTEDYLKVEGGGNR